MLNTKEIRKLISEGKENEVPEEDLQCFYENDEARNNFEIRGIKNLYVAICAEAVANYKKLRKYVIGKKGKLADDAWREIRSIENFFGSKLFCNVTGFNPEKTKRAIEDTIKREAQKNLCK